MIRTLLLTAALALTALPAFAQVTQEKLEDRTMGTQVFLREGKAATATETAGLVDLITRALDRSRSLHLVAAIMDPDYTIEVEAPQTFLKSADGKRVTVTYEITPPKGDSGRTYTTTCAPTQLERCADAIAQRAERVGRENSFDGQ